MFARLTPLYAAVLLALLPAAASAATVRVDPAAANGACSGSDPVCPTIGQAMQRAASGDTILIAKGTYAETVDVSNKSDLKIQGAGVGEVKITGQGTGDVVTIGSSGVSISGLTVDVPANGGRAVTVGGAGALLSTVLLQRAAATTANVPVLEVSGPGSATVTGAFIVQGAGAAGTPAIRTLSTQGLVLAESTVISSTGPALVAEAGTGNQVTRSTLASTESASDAIRILSASAGNRGITVDSSNLLGGSGAAGLLARSTGSSAGDIAVQARHVTLVGSAKGIVLDASAANGPGGIIGARSAGNIDGKVFSSIVHGTSETRRHAPQIDGVTSTANTARLTFANSDAPPATANNGSVEMGGATFTEDGKLFTPKTLKLRADAPVIDKGGALQAGEAIKDIDGDAREVDGPDGDATATSDIGADEYVNQPPTAAFGITDKRPRAGQLIGLIAGATDPEQDQGGGIVEYRWDFGDGQKETTTAGAVAHTYASPGTYQATLQVVDRQGAVSPVTAPQAVEVRVRPDIALTLPKEGAILKLNPARKKGSRRRPKGRPMSVAGKLAENAGITRIEVSLYLTKRAPKRRRRTATRSQVAPKICEFYSGRLLVKKACDKEIWLPATVSGSFFTLATKRGVRLIPGTYEVRVRAFEGTTLLTTAYSVKDGTLAHFRVK